jgi:arylamine N-acetyltransferase
VKAICRTPESVDRRVTSLISVGVRRWPRNLGWRHRKLISAVAVVAPFTCRLAGTPVMNPTCDDGMSVIGGGRKMRARPATAPRPRRQNDQCLQLTVTRVFVAKPHASRQGPYEANLTIRLHACTQWHGRHDEDDDEQVASDRDTCCRSQHVPPRWNLLTSTARRQGRLTPRSSS